MLVLIAATFSAAVYARGVRALWASAGRGRGVRRWQTAAFYIGLLTLVIAVESPLDGVAHALFAAHMVQHLLLILVAAPLVVLGAPLVALAWALPLDQRAWIAWLPKLARSQIVAFALHSAALWLWHIPRLYDAALASVPVHLLEHASFVGTAGLFWWSVLHARAHVGAGILYVFALALQSTVLGALLTFAPTPWYTAHLELTQRWGLSPLDDQQLAGLIMWVPGGLVYLGSALALLSRVFVRTPGPARRRPAGR